MNAKFRIDAQGGVTVSQGHETSIGYPVYDSTVLQSVARQFASLEVR